MTVKPATEDLDRVTARGLELALVSGLDSLFLSLTGFRADTDELSDSLTQCFSLIVHCYGHPLETPIVDRTEFILRLSCFSVEGFNKKRREVDIGVASLCANYETACRPMFCGCPDYVSREKLSLYRAVGYKVFIPAMYAFDTEPLLHVIDYLSPLRVRSAKDVARARREEGRFALFHCGVASSLRHVKSSEARADLYHLARALADLDQAEEATAEHAREALSFYRGGEYFDGGET